VLFTVDSQFQLYWADGRQHVWRCVVERFPDVNVVNRVPHGSGEVMLWAGINYRKLKPIVVPFICRHHLMFQHDNGRPHVARICTQFLEFENVSVLPWPAYSPDMSPIEHVWDALDLCVQLHTVIEEEWDNIPQATK
jgi:hypothetical protein